MRLRWRQFGRVLRWNSVLLPLVAAGLAGLATLVPILDGTGNRWCNNSGYVCSVTTNLLGVVLVAGLTSYWYYGVRRALLLSRHRRIVLARLDRERAGDEPAGEDSARDAIMTAVLSRYADWGSQPPVTVVTGTSGSGKTVFLADVVRRLARTRSWYVPLPVDDLPGGGEQDILDAAQRQLDVLLHDASVNPSLIESLGRSLIQARRLMIVIDDIDRVGPALSSYERALVVQRLMSSAQRLDLPLLATAQSGSVEWFAGSVIELPHRPAAYVRRRIDEAPRISAELKELVLPALTGPLAAPLVIDRLVTLLRRDADHLAEDLAEAGPEAADLVIWQRLAGACELPGGVLTGQGLGLVAFVLLLTGQREITVGAGQDWQQALRLGEDTGTGLPAHHVGFDEVATYVQGGLLDPDSSPVTLRFTSAEIQAVLAAQFLSGQPRLVAAVVPHLGTTAAARMAVAAVLRGGKKSQAASAHRCLMQALTSGPPVNAGSLAAGLALAVRYPPAGWDGADDAAGRLALVLADRVTGASGPAVSVAGMRDAVQALSGHEVGSARHLLTALHSSSFQVRLTVALALIRRGTWDQIQDSAEKWISEAETELGAAGGVAHPLGLALWFCPHLGSADLSGRGEDLYRRGLALAMREDSNPLMYEISLARGFKLAAWARPDRPADARALDLLAGGIRFWHSRICLIHAIGIRLATRDGRQATAGAGLLDDALAGLARAEDGDPHPLVREAARTTRQGLAGGADAAGFCWLAESDMGRSNYRLGDEAMRLLGDVSLFLNLTYCAEPWSGHEWQMLGTSSDIPACIRQPAHRQRYMTSGCPRECPSGLCPYPSAARRPRGRGELSAAFCQAQHDVAERLGPAPWHEGRSARPQVDFWLYAEQALANRDGWEINL